MQRFKRIWLVPLGLCIALAAMAAVIEVPEAPANMTVVHLGGGGGGASGGEITFIAGSAANNGGSASNTGEVPMPVGTQAGDIMIALIADDYTNKVFSLEGWTKVATSVNGVECESNVFYRIAEAEEAGPYTFEDESSNNRSINTVIGTFRTSSGTWDTTSLLADDTTNTSTGSASITTTSITCPASSMLITGFMHESARSVSEGPTDMTQVGISNSGSTSAVMYYEARSAGAVTKTIEWSSSDALTAHALYLVLE